VKGPSHTAAEALLAWPNVLAWRVRRHGLAERAPAAEALAVVARIGGLHAQLLSSAELTLHARVDDLDPDAVSRALWTDRTLVKTWAMRGTLHLLAAAELPAFVGAMRAIPPRHHQGAWLKHHGLTRALADAILEAIPEALADGELTREELATAVERRTGESGLAQKLSGGFGDLLKPAAFAGDLCFAPNAGRNVRFTRPDRWLRDFSTADTQTGVAHVIRRYLAAYGPATREQFARWVGMTSAPQAAKLLRSLGDDVTEVVLDGARAFALATDLEDLMAAEPEGTVNLLPAFDQYVVGAPRGTAAVLDPVRRADVYRPQGWISPVLLVDGVIAGTWSANGKGRATEIVVDPFEKLSAAVAQRAEAEAERLAAILATRS
jgi:hypothetical protein